jgi:hypothetical protein
MRSHVGALMSEAGEAGICLVLWLNSPNDGRTSLSTAEVKINNCATGVLQSASS